MKPAFSPAFAWVGFALILSQGYFDDTATQRPTKVQTPFIPDPVTVTRSGSVAVPQDGWNVVHIEGSPYGAVISMDFCCTRNADYCQSIAKVAVTSAGQGVEGLRCS